MIALPTNLDPLVDHSPFGGSKAEMILNSPGSLKLYLEEPPPPASPAALEGTLAHAHAEHRLLFGGWKPDIEPDMRGFLQGYVEFCESFMGFSTLNGVETHVHVPQVHELCWGWVDFWSYNAKNGLLDVVDLKYGQGVQVYPDENPQLMLYALGAWNHLAALVGTDPRVTTGEFNRIRLWIAQPRCGEGHKPLRTWECGPSELLKFRDRYAQAVAQAISADPGPPVVGKWCKFCHRKAACPSQLAEVHELARLDFAVPAETDKLARALELAPVVRAWADEVERYALEEALKGRSIPGKKAVAGRSSRYWSDEKRAADFLLGRLKLGVGAAYKPRKLVTAPQAEKLIRPAISHLPKAEREAIWSDFSDLIARKTGGPTLVDSNDKREAYDPAQSAIEDFSDGK